MIGRFDNQRGNETEIAERLIEEWYVAGWDNGCLWVQAQRQTLSLPQFCSLLKRIQRLFRNDVFRVVVFHFDRVEAHPDHWELVVRLLQEFAKSTQTHCRIVQYNRRHDCQTCNLGNPAHQSPDTRRSIYPPIKLNGISLVIE